MEQTTQDTFSFESCMSTVACDMEEVSSESSEMRPRKKCRKGYKANGSASCPPKNTWEVL